MDSVGNLCTQPRWCTVQINARDFFLGYRKVDMQPHEILARVLIPFTQKSEYVREFKQAHRRDDDIAIVNAGMRFALAKSHQGQPVSSAIGVNTFAMLPWLVLVTATSYLIAQIEYTVAPPGQLL